MGLRDQLGVKAETTWATAVVVDRFFDFTSESLQRNKNTLQGESIRRSGRGLRRSSKRREVSRDASGDLVLDVPVSGFGLWLEHTFGAVATSQPDDTNAPSVFEHDFSVGSLTDKSLTVQVGREQEDETVVPFTYPGAKISQLQLAVDNRGLLVATISVDAQDELTDGETLAEASYTDADVFGFAEADLTLDGTTVAQCRSAQATIENAMDTERFFIGSGGTKGQQRDNDKIGVSGQLVADFVSLAALYESFRDDTALALVLSFEGDVIEDTQTEYLELSVPDVRLNGETPNVDGPGLPSITVPWEGFHDGTSDVTAKLRSTDSTP